ncbi:protein of unknown function [Paraburkholderia kururiensis]
MVRGRTRAIPEDGGERACVGVRFDERRDQQQHAGHDGQRRRGDRALPEVAGARGRQRTTAVRLRRAGHEGVAHAAGRRCRGEGLRHLLHALPRHRRPRLRADARAARGQSERAGEGCVVAHQRHAERHARPRDSGHSGAVSDAAVRLCADGPADRGRAHVHSSGLEQSRAGSQRGRRGEDTPRHADRDALNEAMEGSRQAVLVWHRSPAFSPGAICGQTGSAR